MFLGEGAENLEICVRLPKEWDTLSYGCLDGRGRAP